MGMGTEWFNKGGGLHGITRVGAGGEWGMGGYRGVCGMGVVWDGMMREGCG